jgi:hypothetical protein
MKKITAFICAAAMAIGLIGSTVWAAPSPTNNIAKNPTATTASGEALTLKIADPVTTDWKTVVKDEKVAEAIEKLNSGEMTLVEIVKEFLGGTEVELANGEKVDLTSFDMLTPMFDIAVETGNLQPGEKVSVSWEQPALVGLSEKNNVLVIHYSDDGGKFELVKPDSINYTTGAIKCELTGLSPVGIIYTKTDGTTGGTGSTGSTSGNNTESVKTGDSSPIIMYSILAVAALGCIAGVVVYRKKKNM